MRFARETLATVKEEVEPLLRAHYAEIAWRQDNIPLAVDWERYLELEKAGKFVVFTVRKDGTLLGYSAYFITHHLHYRTTIFASNDVLYLDPSARGGTGTKFIKWCDEQLKQLGAHIHGLHIKLSLDWSPIAERLGFDHVDHVYLKWL